MDVGNRIVLGVIVVLLVIFLVSTSLRANVPPPPANQIMGVDDGVFNDLAEEDCRLCHENPDQFPVKDETLPNRHHLLVGTSIPGNTDAPFGTPGELYECLSCHAVDSSSGVIEFIVERDCSACHIQASIFELTVHHRTDEALGNLPQGPDCKVCHGSLVDNMNDGHFIPNYTPTQMTPTRSGGIAPPLNIEGNGAGACDYCHSTGTGDPEVPGVDTDSGVLVYSNEDTHHMTGFWGGMGAHGFVCFWCHDFNLPFEEQIRVCENCHGPNSLHSIQTDSNGDGVIIPGNELPGYGHTEECLGCHGFVLTASSASVSESAEPGTGPMVPHITGISSSVLTAGTAAAVTINGIALTNMSQGTEIASNVRLTASDGTTTELIPDAVSEGSLTVTIPGTLATGNYRVNAVKMDKISNPKVISIKPDVGITGAQCNKRARTMTISGENFGERPEGSDTYINVEVNGQPADIMTWMDTGIQVSVSRCPSNYILTVHALFGSDTVQQNKGKVKKPRK